MRAALSDSSIPAPNLQTVLPALLLNPVFLQRRSFAALDQIRNEQASTDAGCTSHVETGHLRRLKWHIESFLDIINRSFALYLYDYGVVIFVTLRQPAEYSSAVINARNLHSRPLSWSRTDSACAFNGPAAARRLALEQEKQMTRFFQTFRMRPLNSNLIPTVYLHFLLLQMASLPLPALVNHLPQ